MKLLVSSCTRVCVSAVVFIGKWMVRVHLPVLLLLGDEIQEFQAQKFDARMAFGEGTPSSILSLVIHCTERFNKIDGIRD